LGDVIVELPNGKIQGVTEQTRTGQIYNSFYGVRYGKSPTNELRLQESPKKRNTKDSSKESHPTPNKKRLSIITHSNGANHDGDLEKALRHLKPLQLLNFDLDQFEKDEKLLNQIAFVKLQSLKAAHKHRSKINGMSDDNSHLSMNSESKHHSFFKIKLKMKPSFKTKRITKVSL